jgi:hypothetical protein
MDQNRYQPPRARLNLRNREPGSIPRAVAIGALIDIGGTFLGSFAIAMGYAMILGAQGQSEDAIRRALETVDPWSFYGLLLLGMGLGMSALAGYRCALIANRANYLAPGILSVVSVTSGALMSGGQAEQRELLIFSALTVIAILVGASLWMRNFNEPTAPPAAKQ